MASCSMSDNKVKPTLNVGLASATVSGSVVTIIINWNIPPASNSYSKWDYGISAQYSWDNVNWISFAEPFGYNRTGGNTSNRWYSGSGTKAGSITLYKEITSASSVPVYFRLNDLDSKTHNNVPSASCVVETGLLRIPLTGASLATPKIIINKKGSEALLKIAVQPNSATYYTFDFYSKDPTKFSIDQTGKIKALKYGKCEVGCKVTGCDGKMWDLKGIVVCNNPSNVAICIKGKYVECEVYYCVNGKYIRCEVGYCSNGKFVQIG